MVCQIYVQFIERQMLRYLAFLAMATPLGDRLAGGVPPLSIRGACPHWAIRAGRFALHSNRTFITRGLYFFDRCSFDSDVLQVYPIRNYNIRFVEAFRFCLADGVPPQTNVRSVYNK